MDFLTGQLKASLVDLRREVRVQEYSKFEKGKEEKPMKLKDLKDWIWRTSKQKSF